MSMGSKQSAPKIDAPPQITSTTFTSPTGDQFITGSSGHTQYSTSTLSPGTQAVVDDSLQGLQNLASTMSAPDPARVAQINQRANDFYNLQAQGINNIYDGENSQMQSDLNKRFGGAYNSTFGADALSQLENDRATELSNSYQQSGLLAEDLNQQDEADQNDRFQIFQNYLNGLTDEAEGANSTGSQVLSTSRSNATQVATAQAQLAQQVLNNANNSTNTRLGVLGTVAGDALKYAPQIATGLHILGF